MMYSFMEVIMNFYIFCGFNTVYYIYIYLLRNIKFILKTYIK